VNTIEPISFQGRKYPISKTKSLTNQSKKLQETGVAKAIKLGTMSALAALGFVNTKKEISEEKLIKSNRKLYDDLLNTKKVDIETGVAIPAYTDVAIIEIIKETRQDKLKGELLKQFLYGSKFMNDAAVKEAVELHRADFKTAHEIKNKYCNGNVDEVVFFNRFQNKSEEIKKIVNEQENLNIANKSFIADCIEEFPLLKEDKKLLSRLIEYTQKSDNPLDWIWFYHSENKEFSKLDTNYEVYRTTLKEGRELLKTYMEDVAIGDMITSDYPLAAVPRLRYLYKNDRYREALHQARFLGIKNLKDQMRATTIIQNGNKKDLQEFVKRFGHYQTDGDKNLKIRFSELLKDLEKTIELRDSLKDYGIEADLCNLIRFRADKKSKLI